MVLCTVGWLTSITIHNICNVQVEFNFAMVEIWWKIEWKVDWKWTKNCTRLRWTHIENEYFDAWKFDFVWRSSSGYVTAHSTLVFRYQHSTILVIQHKISWDFWSDITTSKLQTSIWRRDEAMTYQTSDLLIYCTSRIIWTELDIDACFGELKGKC